MQMVAVIALVVVALMPPSSWSTAAQTDVDATVVATTVAGAGGDQTGATQGDTPVEQATETPVTENPESTLPPTDAPVETVAPTEPPAANVPVATLPATVPATTAPTAAPQPSLTYSTPAQPVCQTVSGGPERIESGATLDYTCTSTLAVTGTQVSPDAVVLDWSVTAGVDGDWQVQLRSAATGAAWTPVGAGHAAFSYQTGVPAETATATAGGFDATITLAFDVRVRRLACGISAQSIVLRTSARGAVPGVDAASVAQTGELANPLVLTPALASIPDPSMTLEGPLDFGTVPVTSAGPANADTTANLVIALEGLGASCGDWRLSLRAITPAGGDGVLSASDLIIVSVDGQPLAGGPCALSGVCVINDVTAGPGAPDTGRYTVTVSLRLPDGSPPGTFDATITGRLDQV